MNSEYTHCTLWVFFLVSIPHGVDSYVTYTCNFFLCGDITYKCSFKSSSFILNIYTHTHIAFME